MAYIIGFILFGLFAFFPRTVSSIVIIFLLYSCSDTHETVKQKGMIKMSASLSNQCPIGLPMQVRIENGSNRIIGSIPEIFVHGNVPDTYRIEYRQEYGGSYPDEYAVGKIIHPGETFSFCGKMPYAVPDVPAALSQVDWHVTTKFVTNTDEIGVDDPGIFIKFIDAEEAAKYM